MERRAIWSVATFLFVFLQSFCTALSTHDCPASSCGNIPNISYPFRLSGDPSHCGNKRYELDCENNATFLTLFSGKYLVHHINYTDYSIRVSDAGVVEDTTCSFIPRYFLYSTNFSDNINRGRTNPLILSALHLHRRAAYFNCTKPITNDRRYVKVDTTRCGTGGHFYAVLIHEYSLDFNAMDIKVGCQLKVASLASSRTLQEDRHFYYNKNFSYDEIHNLLAYGFWLFWGHFICDEHCGKGNDCSLLDESRVRCTPLPNCRDVFRGFIFTNSCGLKQFFGVNDGVGDDGFLIVEIVQIGKDTGRYALPYFIVKFLLGVVAFIIVLIYKWGRRHTSSYDNIEEFLEGNTFMPIRYSYKEIKQMTRGFKEKLGQGGFGMVYKGKLRSGPFVAIKMLSKSKANGQEFISEVATIGMIHHANVVRLIGFCVEASKRALVYEFMPNGSLDRYIFSKADSISLTYEQIYEISLGVARGIAYLHQGCDMQILHFDIKPHNILLDENFVPKVSDFGLAKLYPIDKSIVTLTAARGTIGYMAPELFYHNIGGISYKADVYSFGMLLMEMASRRKNLNKQAEHSSELFFPLWIHDQLSRENEMEMEDITNEKNNEAKKMFIVALWCIQLKPSDRPSMNKVVEMLEGELENIDMPPKPSLYPDEMIQEDLTTNSDQTLCDDSIGSTSYIE
ncbi:LEAF RUST 10 DISEASE-RESISTANCE LOCUS RECEPTOR-LIKE PROTEIN KINASE-like 2.1 [Gastrolobium bilobum]|uniref:LEAF RUST 10 DISEASE-RESISTANCE LOCUS RECEPTOR-LIKE PROTEIN KINASE-like 2.1 n=1 Tax=Gastrolobium bilobum TaxID=150636 RepID=UPI002AB2E0CB|nr:LEAF RUST 10 DISEASE-RESISTANCE LOCUS RECEPTOR-LIKE PROTEIN KINASE-like 2.1 [Gastrolobium bilobum]